MRKYFYIAIGGLLGAISRYSIKGIQIFAFEDSFLLNTFLINVIGSLLLGLITTLALKYLLIDEDIRLGIGTGLLGAFTTFSTFSRELSELLLGNRLLVALIYVSASVFFGLCFAYIGVRLADMIVKKLKVKVFE